MVCFVVRCNESIKSLCWLSYLAAYFGLVALLLAGGGVNLTCFFRKMRPKVTECSQFENSKSESGNCPVQIFLLARIGLFLIMMIGG